MERLGRRNGVHVLVGEPGRFRRSRDADEVGAGFEHLLGCRTHDRVRLDGYDSAARVQEKGREDARPRPDVCHGPSVPEGELVAQQVHERSWVGGAEPDVVLHPIGEASRRVGHGRAQPSGIHSRIWVGFIGLSSKKSGRWRSDPQGLRYAHDVRWRIFGQERPGLRHRCRELGAGGGPQPAGGRPGGGRPRGL